MSKSGAAKNALLAGVISLAFFAHVPTSAASTAFVAPSSVLGTSDAVHYVADPGETNNVAITVSDFVKRLRDRYGILIDSTGEENDSPEIARALEVNYTFLKDRLRQLGFFTDLSDASISQVIKPRFPVTVETV